MKVKLFVEFECGEKTCASEPEKFCRWVRTKKLGQVWHCHLFDTKLYDEDGWLMRCGECLAAQKAIE